MHHKESSIYHNRLSVVEDDSGSPTEQQFTEVCHKIWGKSKNNDKLKAEFKSNPIPKNRTFMKTPYLNPEFILEYQTQQFIKIKQHRENRQIVKDTIQGG